MDAKVHSKTCLEKPFFPILSPFMRVKLKNVKKVLNRAQKFLFLKNQVGVSKNAEFYAESNPLRKFQKSSQKKSYCQKTQKNGLFQLLLLSIKVFGL